MPARPSAWIVVAAVMLSHASSLFACDTPVYRYAMYRWKPQRYEVYAFHKKPISGEAAKLRTSINSLIDHKVSPANIALIPVSVAKDPELKSVPDQVRQAFKASGFKSDPTYIVFSPVGRHLFSGQLDSKSVQALVDSPARKKLAGLLSAGRTGVLVLLTSSDKQANERARTAIKKLRENVRKGKTSLVPTEGKGALTKSVTTPEKEFGLVEVDRADKAESWFVRSLVGIEADLPKLDKPMVFTVYGRARAIPPCIDKGITEQNLAKELTFIAGACSCTIKEQNPGVDLLVRQDWEKAAANIATKFGSEEGNEKQIGSSEFFPDLLIPGSEPKKSNKTDVKQVAKADPKQSGGGDRANVTSVRSGDPQKVTQSSVVQASNNKESQGSADKNSVSEDKTPELPKASYNALAKKGDIAAKTPTTSNASSSDNQAQPFLGVWMIIGGLGVGVVVLFGATFLVLRSR